jgi:hypothetical protein
MKRKTFGGGLWVIAWNVNSCCASSFHVNGNADGKVVIGVGFAFLPLQSFYASQPFAEAACDVNVRHALSSNYVQCPFSIAYDLLSDSLIYPLALCDAYYPLVVPASYAHQFFCSHFSDEFTSEIHFYACDWHAFGSENGGCLLMLATYGWPPFVWLKLELFHGGFFISKFPIR